MRPRSSSAHGRLALLLGLALLALGLAPAGAGAALQTIDFDGPQPLETPIDSVGQVSFPVGQGFRPYRVDVGARAHSGTTVADLGRCRQEVEATGGTGQCEFFQARTTGQLATTAERVTLFAGMFDASDPAEQATLVAFDTAGQPIASSGPVAIDASGFDTELSVSSAAGNIASFQISASVPTGEGSTNGGDLGIDDLKVSFADGAKPDFSVVTTNEVVSLVQGQQTSVPLNLARVNGSNGPIGVSVSGLPVGVSAAVSPNPVPGTQTAATLTLTAAPNAPDTRFIPTEATIAASPSGGADAGPGPRTTKISVRVAANFSLAIGEQSDASVPPGDWIGFEAPACAPVDLPLKVTRDIANTQNVSLSMRGDTPEAVTLPPEVSAEFLPGSVVAPGGDLAAERTVRVRAGAGAFIPPGGFPMAIEGQVGSGPSAATHVLPLRMFRAKSVATIENVGPRTPPVKTPQLGRPGSRVVIHGNGFCPGTDVEVGNEDARVAANVVDEHTLEFTVPRYATSNRVLIFPPDGMPPYFTSEELKIDSFRNTAAFQFPNPSGGDLSLNELRQAFGDDIYIRVNLCWPYGHCYVPTGIPSPVAAIEWGIFDQISGTRGHCFGMALASQELRSGRISLAPLLSDGGEGVWSVPGSFNPSAAVGSLLDVEHVKQYSDEYIHAYLDYVEGGGGLLTAQLRTLEREFSHGRTPIVSVKDKPGVFSEGHVVTAYDVEQTARTASIYVWDSNRPFHVNPEDFDGAVHRRKVDSSVIHIDKVNGTWSFDLADGDDPSEHWSGRNDGTLWVMPAGTVPDHPTMPGLDTLETYLEDVTFGSSGEAVRTTGGSPGAHFIPAADGDPGSGQPAPGGHGTWASDDPRHPLRVNFDGVADGSYTQSYTAPGFVAAAVGVKTGKGVRDTVRGDGDSLVFAGGEDRPLRVELARQDGTAAGEAASLRTTGSAGGSDTAGFGGDGALTYAHDGAPTTLSFTLTTVKRDGGPASFVSGPVAVGRGDRLTVRPDRGGLGRVRLTVRHADGRRTTRTLSNHGHGHARLSFRAPRIRGRRLSTAFKLSGLRGQIAVGATLRLFRGRHLVAQHSVGFRGGAGRHEVSWRLPRAVGRGRYRLVVDARALKVAGRGPTATAGARAHRSFRLRVGRR